MSPPPLSDLPPNPSSADEPDLRRFLVPPEQAGKRADAFLAAVLPDTTRSQVKLLFDAGKVAINGKPAKAGHKLIVRDQVIVEGSLKPGRPENVTPEPMPLDIVHEDRHLIVINKAQGMVVHPAAGHWDHTLVNGLLHHTSLAGGTSERPGIVHRLDKDTSGLLVVAKTVQTHGNLSRQFSDRTIGRIYAALVKGRPQERGEISGLIGRHPSDRKRFSGRTGRGKPSITTFRTLEAYGDFAALLELKLGTGRTHQIRVHMSEAGHPVLGDPVYGGRKVIDALKPVVALLPGQALHAGLLEFTHPATGERLQFRADPPGPFAQAIALLRSLT